MTTRLRTPRAVFPTVRPPHPHEREPAGNKIPQRHCVIFAVPPLTFYATGHLATLRGWRKRSACENEGRYGKILSYVSSLAPRRRAEPRRRRHDNASALRDRARPHDAQLRPMRRGSRHPVSDWLQVMGKTRICWTRTPRSFRESRQRPPPGAAWPTSTAVQAGDRYASNGRDAPAHPGHWASARRAADRRGAPGSSSCFGREAASDSLTIADYHARRARS
jgi:hypothetical protein